jgi:hypothetical protein
MYTSSPQTLGSTTESNVWRIQGFSIVFLLLFFDFDLNSDDDDDDDDDEKESAVETCRDGAVLRGLYS